MRKLTLAILIFGLASTTVVLADDAPQVLEGRVVDVVSAGSFVLAGDQRAMIYHRTAGRTQLAVGDRVRVVGTPIDDWMRMDGVEINADSVEPISP